MNPDFDAWAKNLLEELYYAPEEHRISLLSEHLKKASARGYTDGSNNAWCHEQEAHPPAELPFGLRRAK